MHKRHEEATADMKLRSHRLRWALVPVLALGVALTGQGMASARTGSAKLADATLNGSGSTFQQAFDEEAISAFTDKNSGVTINYAGGGSGKGRQDFADQVVDFAGTDATYPSADLALRQGRRVPLRADGRRADHRGVQPPGRAEPEAVGPDDLEDLPAPDHQVERSRDRQGEPEGQAARHRHHGGAVEPMARGRRRTSRRSSPRPTRAGGSSARARPSAWPADTQGGQGNAGVAAIVSGTEGAIGYVDYSDAKAAGLKYAAVRNQLGKYIKPSLKGASEAAATVAINPDLTYDPIYATGATSYPITSPTWILVYKNQDDANKGKALKAWLTYILTKGQKQAAGVDYAPLPPGLAKQALAQVKTIQT